MDLEQTPYERNTSLKVLRYKMINQKQIRFINFYMVINENKLYLKNRTRQIFLLHWFNLNKRNWDL